MTIVLGLLSAGLPLTSPLPAVPVGLLLSLAVRRRDVIEDSPRFGVKRDRAGLVDAPRRDMRAPGREGLDAAERGPVGQG